MKCCDLEPCTARQGTCEGFLSCVRCCNNSANFSVVQKMDFDLGSAQWLGANFRNKCPRSLAPSCKRQAVITIVWWIKLELDLSVFGFKLAQSYISRNPLILNKLNSRGTTVINTLNMAFQAQCCQVHLFIFYIFPGKKGKFCRWPPKN